MPLQDFLQGIQLRPVRHPVGTPFAPIGLALGKGRNALEVLVVSSDRVPSATRVRSLWKERHGRRPAPLLLVAVNDDRATLCGTFGDDPPIYLNVETGHADRIFERRGATALAAASAPHSSLDTRPTTKDNSCRFRSGSLLFNVLDRRA